MGDTTGFFCLAASLGWGYRLICGEGGIEDRNRSTASNLSFCPKGQWDRQADRMTGKGFGDQRGRAPSSVWVEVVGGAL